MIRELQEQKSNRSHSKLDELISRLVSDFEHAISNDLSVKSAFDNLFETISELHKNRELLGLKDIKDTLDALRRVDYVLQCIF
jgi:hypothetical protein